MKATSCAATEADRRKAGVLTGAQDGRMAEGKRKRPGFGSTGCGPALQPRTVETYVLTFGGASAGALTSPNDGHLGKTLWRSTSETLPEGGYRAPIQALELFPANERAVTIRQSSRYRGWAQGRINRVASGHSSNIHRRFRTERRRYRVGVQLPSAVGGGHRCS